MIRTRVLWVPACLCLLYICQQTILGADAKAPVAKPVTVAKPVVVVNKPIALIGPRIVGPNEVAAGDLVILNAQVSGNAGLDWAISPPEAKSRFYVDSNHKVALFASRTKGTYIFALAVATDGKAVCLIHVLSNGVGPGPEPDPEPDPDPNPDPTPDPGKRFVMVVSETGERTVAQAATLMGLRDYLQEKKHDFRFVDADIADREGKTPQWFEHYVTYIDKAKIEGPALVVGVLSSDGKSVTQVYAEAMPKSAALAIAAVKKKGG